MTNLSKRLQRGISEKTGLRYVPHSEGKAYRVILKMRISTIEGLKERLSEYLTIKELINIISNEIKKSLKHRHPKRSYSCWSTWREEMFYPGILFFGLN